MNINDLETLFMSFFIGLLILSMAIAITISVYKLLHGKYKLKIEQIERLLVVLFISLILIAIMFGSITLVGYLLGSVIGVLTNDLKISWSGAITMSCLIIFVMGFIDYGFGEMLVVMIRDIKKCKVKGDSDE